MYNLVMNGVSVSFPESRAGRHTVCLALLCNIFHSCVSFSTRSLEKEWRCPLRTHQTNCSCSIFIDNLGFSWICFIYYVVILCIFTHFFFSKTKFNLNVKALFVHVHYFIVSLLCLDIYYFCEAQYRCF